MPVDYGLLNSPNIGGAFQAGMNTGREMKRQQVVQGALSAYAANPNDEAATSALIAADPALGFKLQERQREQQRLDARRAVFAAPTTGMDAGGAPAGLVDPSALPPRTDGLQINQEALRNLYQIDPDAALEVQKTIYNADAAGAKRMQASGELMATAAYRLSKLPVEARAAELQAMAPLLQQLGIAPEMLARADTSDASLQRYMTLGRSIGDVMKEDDAKYLAVPKDADLVNIRDPDAVREFTRGLKGEAPIQPGAVVNGKTFRGGDYRDPANWSGGAASTTPATFPRPS